MKRTFSNQKSLGFLIRPMHSEACVQLNCPGEAPHQTKTQDVLTIHKKRKENHLLVDSIEFRTFALATNKELEGVIHSFDSEFKYLSLFPFDFLFLRSSNSARARKNFISSDSGCKCFSKTVLFLVSFGIVMRMKVTHNFRQYISKSPANSFKNKATIRCQYCTTYGSKQNFISHFHWKKITAILP